MFSLNYLASELHASFGPLFNPSITEEGRTAAVAKLHTKLKYINEGGLPQTKADAPVDVAALYLYIILTWAGYVKVRTPLHVPAALSQARFCQKKFLPRSPPSPLIPHALRRWTSLPTPTSPPSLPALPRTPPWPPRTRR